MNTHLFLYHSIRYGLVMETEYMQNCMGFFLFFLATLDSK